MKSPTNIEFITAVFGNDAPWCHVTDFKFDPANIPKESHLASWKGDYFSRYNMQPGSNQYFTISTFYCDNEQVARRRKALYRQTHCIVLDDVKEKLLIDEVLKLPSPSWILETSPGSEQWGYILNTPCTERSKVENLLDGLVANGLAPEGRDPGMKGVTRYVRLPEGSNSKKSKLINGKPVKCIMKLWQPFTTVTIEQLAIPFNIDLDALRRESRIDGAADLSDHPLININDVILIKEVRSDGRFDITCPWVDEHTDSDDSGSAMFTNRDGSIGFKCHHGACQNRTGSDLLRFIESRSPGFNGILKNWQIMREFSITAQPGIAEPISFLTPVNDLENETSRLQSLCDELKREHPTSQKAREIASKVLKFTDDLPKIERLNWHDLIRDTMGWSKGELKEILKDLQAQWYVGRTLQVDFYNSSVFVKELNQFYNWDSRLFFTPDAFQNSYSSEDPEAKKNALQGGMVKKADKLDYAPKKPKIFTEHGIVYANAWSEVTQHAGVKGDISRWYQHFDALGWGDHRKHIIQWLAFTLRHPEQKINHILMMGSSEGCGKDFLLYPLSEVMGENHSVISGEELLRDFDDHLLSTKYLHINEAELGDRREAMAISNRLKPLAAAPPDTLRVNQKGIKPIKIRNIVNVSMTTNSLMPLRLNGASRRFFGVWSDLNPRDENDNMTSDWKNYWADRWSWMKGQGWKNVVWYLINEVDLSDFNAQEAPPMTDFLRDIREASKSPMQQTVEAFIAKKHGTFKSSIVTSTDLSETLKSGIMFSPGDMYADGVYFNPTKVGMIMKEIGRYRQVTAYNSGGKVKLWVIHDSEVYKSMNPSELYREYKRQMAVLKGSASLSLIK